ncbi:MAG TPA: enoyl-CoA hydratase-related protein [Pseudonocardia sp.]|jgi:enoyl-CoA hydratase/carnithine racemase
MVELTLETLRLAQVAAGVLVATLNRPDRLNSMTRTMFHELETLGAALNADRETRVLIITGAGAAFCAGYDLEDAEEIGEMTAMDFLDLQESAARALSGLRSLRIPVIAAVNGAAAGGGLSLSLAADIRLAGESAKFNAAFVRIGLSAGDLGASWLLPRIIGPGPAAEIAFTGRIVSAAEAARLGLVNRVVPDDELLAESVSLAEAIAKNSPAGIRMSKRALQANMEVSSYDAALELENRGQTLLTRGEDMREALTAFKEKRPARFTGR